MPHGKPHLTEGAEARGRSSTPAPRARGDNVLTDIGNVLVNVAAGMQGKPFPAIAQARNKAAQQANFIKEGRLQFEASADFLTTGFDILSKTPGPDQQRVGELLAKKMGQVSPVLAEVFTALSDNFDPEQAGNTARLFGGQSEFMLSTCGGDNQCLLDHASDPDFMKVLTDKNSRDFLDSALAKLSVIGTEFSKQTGIPLSKMGSISESTLRQFMAQFPEGSDAKMNLGEVQAMLDNPVQTQATLLQMGFTPDQIQLKTAEARAKDKPLAQIEAEAAATKRGQEAEEVVPHLLEDGLSVKPMSRAEGRTRGLTEATLTNTSSFNPETGEFEFGQTFLGKLDNPTMRKLFRKRNQLSTIVFQIGRLRSVVGKHGDAVLGISGGLNRLFDTAVTQTKTIVKQAFGKTVGNTTADGTEVKLSNFQFTGEFANQSAEVRSRVLQLGFALAVLNNDGSRPSDADFRASMRSFNFDTVGQMFSALDAIVENSAFNVEIAFKNARIDDNLNIRADVQPFLDRATETDVLKAIDEEVKNLRIEGAFEPLSPEEQAAGERAVTNPLVLDLIPELRQ